MWQDRLKRIIEMLEASDVSEIEVHFWGRKFRVSKNATAHNNPAPAASLETLSIEPEAPSSDSSPGNPVMEAEKVVAGVEVKAPMVGTFYAAPSPESPPYVDVGDHVTAGQTLCIIEAMKIMNEIESEVTGRIAEILVRDAQPVEFGQPLLIIEPDYS